MNTWFQSFSALIFFYLFFWFMIFLVIVEIKIFLRLKSIVSYLWKPKIIKILSQKSNDLHSHIRVHILIYSWLISFYVQKIIHLYRLITHFIFLLTLILHDWTICLLILKLKRRIEIKHIYRRKHIFMIIIL